MTWRTKDI